MTGQTISHTAAGATARGRKRKNIRSDQQPQPTQPAKAKSAPKAARAAGIPAGWRVIAAKEFADHISSIRFLGLTIILTLAAATAVYSSAGQLKAVAAGATGVPSLFLYLFFYQPQGSQLPTFVFFIALLGPVLGIAFGFDGVNGERSEGTLPRLVSQPIHRDDVINGKFVAGLAAISVIFVVSSPSLPRSACFNLASCQTSRKPYDYWFGSRWRCSTLAFGWQWRCCAQWSSSGPRPPLS